MPLHVEVNVKVQIAQLTMAKRGIERTQKSSYMLWSPDREVFVKVTTAMLCMMYDERHTQITEQSGELSCLAVSTHLLT